MPSGLLAGILLSRCLLRRCLSGRLLSRRFLPRCLLSRHLLASCILSSCLLSGRLLTRRLLACRLLAHYLLTRCLLSSCLLSGRLLTRRLLTRRLLASRLLASRLLASRLLARYLLTRCLLTQCLLARGLLARYLFSSRQLASSFLTQRLLARCGLPSGLEALDDPALLVFTSGLAPGELLLCLLRPRGFFLLGQFIAERRRSRRLLPRPLASFLFQSRLLFLAIHFLLGQLALIRFFAGCHKSLCLHPCALLRFPGNGFTAGRFLNRCLPASGLLPCHFLPCHLLPRHFLPRHFLLCRLASCFFSPCSLQPRSLLRAFAGGSLFQRSLPSRRFLLRPRFGECLDPQALRFEHCSLAPFGLQAGLFATGGSGVVRLDTSQLLKPFALSDPFGTGAFAFLLASLAFTSESITRRRTLGAPIASCRLLLHGRPREVLLPYLLARPRPSGRG